MVSVIRFFSMVFVGVAVGVLGITVGAASPHSSLVSQEVTRTCGHFDYEMWEYKWNQWNLVYKGIRHGFPSDGGDPRGDPNGNGNIGTWPDLPQCDSLPWRNGNGNGNPNGNGNGNGNGIECIDGEVVTSARGCRLFDYSCDGCHPNAMWGTCNMHQPGENGNGNGPEQ